MAKKSQSSNKPFSSSSRAKTKPAAAPQPRLAAKTVNVEGNSNKPQQELLSVKEQQRILDIFSNTFARELASPRFEETVQEIKGLLFKRDFAAVFGREEYLACYAARWSPTRALCYASIFRGRLRGYLEGLMGERENGASNGLDGVGKEGLRMVSIGGGAAELVAFAALLAAPEYSTGSITLLDSGPWSTKVQRLNLSITTAPPLSKYASETAKAANRSLLAPSALVASVLQQDILSLEEESHLAEILGRQPLVVTIFFTLNELYTSGGIKRTTAFLLMLTACAPAGTLLLVVDSPGSYSEAALGKESKRYPMHWLLDHTLLDGEKTRWDKVESHESVWFRLPDSLNYPIPLENMRYQMHLYRAKELI